MVDVNSTLCRDNDEEEEIKDETGPAEREGVNIKRYRSS